MFNITTFFLLFLIGCATAPHPASTFALVQPPKTALAPTLSSRVALTAATEVKAVVPAKNIPLPGVEYVATPGTTAKAVVAYRDACQKFVELLLLDNPPGATLPVPATETPEGTSTGQGETWAALQAARAAIR